MAKIGFERVPHYLSCCFCPSQAFPFAIDKGLVAYRCVASHVFFITEPNSEGEKDARTDSEIPERSV
jgi:hypothetical protein